MYTNLLPTLIILVWPCNHLKLGFQNIWFINEFWTIAAANMTYTKLQNYTNSVIGEHGIQTFEFMVVVLLLLVFEVFSPQEHTPFYCWTSGLSE